MGLRRVTGPKQHKHARPSPTNHPLAPTSYHNDNQWLTVALEEYRSIRIEIVDAIQAQRTIMQLGITGLSVLIGFGLQDIDPLLAASILVIVTPIVAIFITAGAMGELFRAARGSCFLLGKEQLVNKVVGANESALQWETWLRTQPIFSMRDKAEFLAVFALSTASLALGYYSALSAELHVGRPIFFMIPFAVIPPMLGISSPVLHFHMLRRARRQFLDVAPE